MGSATRARSDASARESRTARRVAPKQVRRPPRRASRPRPPIGADARLRRILFPVWRFALLVLVIALVLVAAGPTVEDQGAARFLTLAGWALGFIGILLLSDELWIREADRRSRGRAWPVPRSSSQVGEIARLRRHVADGERRLGTVRAKLRETRAGGRAESLQDGPLRSIADARGRASRDGGETSPGPAAGQRAPSLLREGSALASRPPSVQQSDLPAAGVSLAFVPANGAAIAAVAVFVRWNRYQEERGRVIRDLLARGNAESFEFPLEGPNDFHALDDVSRVLGYRIAGHPSMSGRGTRLVVLNLRLGEFDESAPRIVFIDNRSLWHHAEGLLDRPDQVTEMLHSGPAEAAARSIGAGLTVDRLAFSNEPLTGVLVREIASFAAHNPGLPVPRLVDLIVNRAFIAGGRHVAVVDALSKIREAAAPRTTRIAASTAPAK